MGVLFSVREKFSSGCPRPDMTSALSRVLSFIPVEKGERKTQTPLSCKLSFVWPCLCGKELCRSAAKGRECAQDGCASGRTVCAPKRLLLFAWQPSGKENLQIHLRFPGVPGAGTPLQRQALLVLWQWDDYVLNVCLLYWIAFGSMLTIFSWFRDEQYCGIVVQQAPRRCFILRLIFWSWILENKSDASSVVASISYHVSIE